VSYWQRRFDGARRVQTPGGADTQRAASQANQSAPEIQAAQTAAPQLAVGQQAQQVMQLLQQEQYRR